ncbi:DNA excision repair protein ERCC-2 [Halopenitus malekzadehii]|uniref:DNA excision repair protein ERCC-2 n=1 Tax=Halopenitus malekzadehii TaxID=1267564 RepID=A0A1H6IKY1_9EURY|nr:ATP-dependent DNA helicase [Halopenitus malekzadehii]SEH49608.1 DNA excision repair protein ERCC-2 [Halopenitus malekzadehii]
MSDPAYLRFFPYEEPYPNQREAMDRVANALSRGQDVLFEGAPGTGKTLSALVPALEHAREHDRTVVITTNVHQQMRQFVEDARAITRTEAIRAVVFKGKSSMCHIDVDYQECQTLRDTTRSLVETEADKGELERRQRELLAESRDGDAAAAEAREVVMEELDDLDEEIAEIDSANVCDHYYNNLTRDTDAFFEWLFEDVRTPEDVYEYAEERDLCGYELLKEGMEGVDLVVCNYHHLLDPTIREQFFRWIDRDPSEIITVFDEAHNVEDAAREHATRTLTENTLESALEEIDGSDDSRAEAAENVVSAFHEALVETYDSALGFGERESVGDRWEDVSIANEDRRDDLTLAFLDRYAGRGIDVEAELAVQLGRAFDEEYDRQYREGETTSRKESGTLQAAQFIATWMEEGAEFGQYPVVSVRRNEATDEVYGRAELYTCIPRTVTSELFEEVAASVLMSATLRPFDVTADVLGLEDVASLAYELAYPASNRVTYAVDTPPLFASDRSDPEVQGTVGELLRDAIRFTPGNTLVFFPSYAEAERYYERLQSGIDGRPEPDRSGPLGTLLLDGSSVETETLRRRLVDGDDCTLFTSLWGTLAEGVSFDDDAARTVIVVGVPYPHLSDRMEAVQAAYDRAFADGSGTRDPGWTYAVEVPTVRKTRQALGRVIRGPDDFGARILADRRYTGADMGKYSVRDRFPPEERSELIDIAPEKVKFGMLNFFTDHDAYDGDPPSP